MLLGKNPHLLILIPANLFGLIFVVLFLNFSKKFYILKSYQFIFMSEFWPTVSYNQHIKIFKPAKACILYYFIYTFYNLTSGKS